MKRFPAATLFVLAIASFLSPRAALSAAGTTTLLSGRGVVGRRPRACADARADHRRFSPSMARRPAQDQIARLNTVRTWVEWAAAEPSPGEYHFEQLELVLSLAQELGLQVIVQVYVDLAPDWIGQRFADGRFVAQNGEAIPSQAAPGFCFDHPGVRQAVLEFYRQAAHRTRNNPAF